MPKENESTSILIHYAIATLHVQGAIYQERELLTTGGKEIKNRKEILQLLEAV